MLCGCGLNAVWMRSGCSLDAAWMWHGCGLDAAWHRCSKSIYIGINAHVTMRDGQTNERTIEDRATQPLNWKAEFGNLTF